MIIPMMKHNDIPVFVYGTLMRGQPASDHMTGADFLGNAVLPDHAIYDLGWYPGVRPCDGESVQGELYLVSEDMLRSMDRYEGEGFLYLRKLVSVMIDGQTENAFVYLYAHEIDESRRMKGRWGDE